MLCVSLMNSLMDTYLWTLRVSVVFLCSYFTSHEVINFTFFFITRFFSTYIVNLGVEERAVVEYAPYQKMPKLKKRPDLRMGSITEGEVETFWKLFVANK